MSVVGLDIGTSRLKAVRFDARWAAADTATEAAPVRRAAGGRCEQDMDDVRARAFEVLSAVAGRSPDRVDLVAVTAQGDGCWLVDGDGRPAGPAILWNDSRAAGIVTGWQQDGTLEKAFRISGCYGAPGLANAQLRWLDQHQPDRVARAETLLSCGSWVFAELTGRRLLDQTEAANPFFDAATRAYDDGLLELFGLGRLRRLLPPAVTGPDRVGSLTADAARRVGLPAGTPVVIAPYDVATAAIGTGAVRTGDAFGVLGTTLCLGVVDEDPHLSRPPNGMTLPGAAADRWLIAYATLVGTEVLDWTARLLALPSAADVVSLAGRSSAADPPVMLPYLSPAGERSPFLDASIRGSIHGLDLDHTPADVARAALDGLTLAVLDCLRAAGEPTSLVLCGGGARSPGWCQDICDAAGIPVALADVAEVGARGAALSAATDLGWFGDLDEAVSALVRPAATLRPHADRNAHYRTAMDHMHAVRDLG